MPHDDLYSVPYNPGTKQGICASLNNILYVEDRGSLFTHGGALSSHGKDVGLQLHERKKKKKNSQGNIHLCIECTNGKLSILGEMGMCRTVKLVLFINEK